MKRSPPLLVMSLFVSLTSATPAVAADRTPAPAPSEQSSYTTDAVAGVADEGMAVFRDAMGGLGTMIGRMGGGMIDAGVQVYDQGMRTGAKAANVGDRMPSAESYGFPKD